jgi:N-glycosylase/DNA lyase
MYRIIKQSDGYLTMHEDYLKQLEQEAFTAGFRTAKKKCVEVSSSFIDNTKDEEDEVWNTDFRLVVEAISNIKEE